MRPQQLRLGIVDDHPVYRAGLAAVLQQSSRAIRVRWTARGIEDAVELQETEPVDGMLVDLHLDGGQSGVDGVGAILARHPGVRLIVLSGLASDLDIAEVKAAGAAGFVHKSAPVDEMVATILDLLGVSVASAAPARTQALAPELTRREREVLALIRQGLTNREISVHLGISVTTVNKHVHHVLVRLNAPNRSAAAQRPAGWDRGRPQKSVTP